MRIGTQVAQSPISTSTQSALHRVHIFIFIYITNNTILIKTIIMSMMRIEVPNFIVVVTVFVFVLVRVNVLVVDIFDNLKELVVRIRTRESVRQLFLGGLRFRLCATLAT